MEKITSQNPKSDNNPEIPYDYVLPFLSFSSFIDNNDQIKFNASLMCKLGREVDGKWEIWPEVHYSENVSDVTTKSVEDPALATLAVGINNLLSDFLNSRGV
jgi:hypothetical protein